MLYIFELHNYNDKLKFKGVYLNDIMMVNVK